MPHKRQVRPLPAGHIHERTAEAFAKHQLGLRLFRKLYARDEYHGRAGALILTTAVRRGA
jgi:hypothetical protein